MQTGQICIRDVVCADRDLTILQAAQLTRKKHVGDIVIVDRTAKGALPLGIITDRDLVIEILAENLDFSQLTAGDVMSTDFITAPENQNVFETIEQMQHNGIRRLPVVDKQGYLLGIITVDDLLELLAMQLGELSKVIAGGRRHEMQARL
jgi:CBS domain-containing protein